MMRVYAPFTSFSSHSQKIEIWQNVGVSERNYVNEEKQDGLTWMAWSSDDVARGRLETPDTCTKDYPGVRFPRKTPPTLKSESGKRRLCGI